VAEVMDRERSHEPDVGLQIDLADALARLVPDQRSALMLVLVEQLSYAEAAEVLQVPEGTVMSRVSRARVVLRAWLDGSARTASPGRPELRRVV
jgi:RNA polymerase sigma-70 factor (ECF subfamily)